MAIWNERIHEKRLEKGITLAQVADKLGVAEATAQRYESGNIKNVPYEHMCAYGELLGCSPAYLMGWDNELLQRQKNSRRKFAKEWNIRFYENKILESFTQLNDDNKKKSISYTENLLANQALENDLLLNAAHARTDIDIPEGVDTSDDDIMDDENF